MATRIRLQRHGKKGKPFYWIVAADSRSKRDGKYLEKIGTYDPNVNPPIVNLDIDATVKWIQFGAQPSDTARNIISREGALLKNHLLNGVKKGALTQEEVSTIAGRLRDDPDYQDQLVQSLKQSRLAAFSAYTNPELTYEEKSNFPPVTHPIVRVHPDRNFRKSIYFTSNTSLEIGGMSLEQGKELHKWLVDYISQPKFCYTHNWQKNDLIMWDNRVLLHRVIPYDYAKYRRAMIRGTVEGEVPVLGPFSNEVRLNNKTKI